MNKDNLTKLVNELISLGEDHDELTYWLEIFDYLSADKQLQLFVNFKQELELLNKKS